MIFEYKQTDTHPNVQQVIWREQVVGTGSSQRHFHGYLSLNNTRYQLTTDMQGRILVKENDVVVGEIEQNLRRWNVRKVFDKTASYFDFRIRGREFQIYHVSFLKKDHNFFQIEENHKTVGMLQKIDKVINYLDRYVCYAESDDLFPYVALWCLFLQSSKYFPFMIAGEGNVARTRTSCSAKHVRELYDPTFIPKIKAMEGIVD